MYTDQERIADALSFTGWTESDIPKTKLGMYADAASQEVDGKLRSVYSVPVADDPDTAPQLVVRIATALAAYQVTLDYYGSTDLDDKDPVVRRWKWATDLLESIRKGETSLGLDTGNTDDSDAEDATVVNPSYSGLFPPEHFMGLDRAPGSFGGWDQSVAIGEQL